MNMLEYEREKQRQMRLIEDAMDNAVLVLEVPEAAQDLFRVAVYRAADSHTGDIHDNDLKPYFVAWGREFLDLGKAMRP